MEFNRNVEFDYKKVLKPKTETVNFSSDDILGLGCAARKVAKEVFGDNNVIMITRVLEDDGQIDIDIGDGVGTYQPSPNSDRFYQGNTSDYDRRRVGRIIVTKNDMEIEGNKGNYNRNTNGNAALLMASLRKHIRECISL